MFGIEPIVELPPIFGMNTVDDLKDLRAGECTELINARPGNPPEIRKGCDVFLISGSENYIVVPPAIAHKSVEGTQHVLFWVQSGTEYKLVKVNAESSRPILTVVGTATGLIDPSFSFVKAHGELYAFCSETATAWDGQINLITHKVVQVGDNFAVSRSVAITEIPSKPSVVEDYNVWTYGTAESEKFVAYLGTYIRRTDEDAFNAYGNPVICTTALPGAVEGLGSLDRAVVKCISPTNVAFKLSVIDDADSRYKAMAQGATHVRIYKSMAQATAEDALAATKYFVVDLPASVPMTRLEINSMTIASNNVTVYTSSSHGFSTGDIVAVLGVGGTDSLNAVTRTFTAGVTGADTLSLLDTMAESFEPYTSGGFIGKAKTIEDIKGPKGVSWSREVNGETTTSYPESGNITVTVAAHGLSTGDYILIKGEGGPFSSVAAKVVQTDGGIIRYEEASGLNGISCTVTVIDENTFILNGVDKRLYNSYSGNTGYILTNVATIALVSAPRNEPVITVNGHGLVGGEYAMVKGVNSPTNYNDKEYEVAVIDPNNIRLVDASTFEVDSYTSGGYLTVAFTGSQWTDTVTDAALTGELYQYSAYSYTAPPLCKFADYVKGRMWLFGVPGQSQKAFYSETIGGDGGTPLDDALSFPQKYSSWFKASNAVTCASDVNAVETGLATLADDIFFFFEERVYALLGGDPTVASPILISPDIGCPLPHTIQKANIPYLGGMCILFISNRGPAVIRAGGDVRLLYEFKVAELWPDTGDLFSDLRTNATTKQYLQRNCTSMFWKDTWTVAYKTYSGVHRVFEYYFSSDMASNESSAHGAFEMELGQL